MVGNASHLLLLAEVGVNMQTNFMIKYTFDKTQGLSATDFTYIRVGFITKKKQGILIQLRDETNTEYISLEMNNNGTFMCFLVLTDKTFPLFS